MGEDRGKPRSGCLNFWRHMLESGLRLELLGALEAALIPLACATDPL